MRVLFSTCLVTLRRNRYSVPCRLANQMVAVHQYADRIEIVYKSLSYPSAGWRLSQLWLATFIFWSLRTSWVPCVTAPHLPNYPYSFDSAAAQRTQQADRIMAKGLSLVPTQGLEAVLVTVVEMVLESAVCPVPSMSPMYWHAWSKLTCRHQSKRRLNFNEELQVDTARYDCLNKPEVLYCFTYSPDCMNAPA